jgi:serine/threonine protein kinase
MDPIDRVFGRDRLQMVTGAHVEVFREAAARGESRRYTKRFLTTADGDYAGWTEREWRILARLIGHGTRCVPDVVQYDRGASGTKLVQTYDAGATVDQWATLLPVARDGHVHAHVFEDCAHWWALAHHCLVALDEIHTLGLVHLDIKGDNICIPVGPADFDPHATDGTMFPMFRKLALIDFAFSLVSGETLDSPLPIGWQQDYDYQSPRLLRALESGRAGDLQPTEALDWRCDMYSLAAMLKRYLPGEQRLYGAAPASGWTLERFHAARSLVFRVREAHDADATSRRPHAELIEHTSAQLGAPDLARSLERGWSLARNASRAEAQALPLTPITRLAPSIRLVIPARDEAPELVAPIVVPAARRDATQETRRPMRSGLVAAAAGVAALVGIVPLFVDVDAFVQRAAAVAIEGRHAMSSALRALLPGNSAGEPGASPPVLAAASNDVDVPATPSEPVAMRAGAEAQESSPAQAESNTPARASIEQNASAGTGAVPNENAKAEPQGSSTSPPTTPSAAASAGLPASPAGSSETSAAARIESYRNRSPQPSAGSRPRVRGESTLAEATRRAQLARTSKPPRTPVSVPPRTQSALASKRTSAAPLVASAQVPLAKPLAIAAAPPAAARPATRAVEARSTPSPTAQDSVTVGRPLVEARTTPLPSAQESIARAPADVPATTGTGTAAAGTSLANRPAVAVEARADVPPPVPGSAAVTAPIAPPVEVPRPVSPPPPTSHQANAAPIVEPPRTYVVPRTRGPTGFAAATPDAATREPPRTLNAPAIPPPRAVAAVPPPEIRSESATMQDDLDDDDYLDQGRRLVASVVPRTAARVYAQMMRVLAVAANAHLQVQERDVLEAFHAAGIASDAPFVASEASARVARRLHEAARHAYASRRHVPEALELQLTAFGANPGDAEIAGTLAFLHLQIVPAQPERARQLALHAIGLRSTRYPTGRPEDWTTFSIASALAGRTVDAGNVLLASLALTRNLDRSCRSAWSALASYGERMREPVQSLMSRLYTQGRDDDSPYCVQRPTRSAGSRY